MKNYKDKRLLEMLDYLDPKFVSETSKYYKNLPKKEGVVGKANPKKQIKYIAALAACVILLSAFIPVIHHIIRNYLNIAGYTETTADETTLTPDITSEDITTSPEPEPTSPETTVPEPDNSEEETTEPLYDGTTASPEPEYDGSRGLVYKLAEDGKSAWLFGMGTCTDADITVASSYNGVPVTMIGEAALADYPRVKSVTLPETVTAIDMRAFKNCTGLEKVSIPDSVSFIGGDAFENCRLLNSVTLPAGLEKLETTLFMNCIGLESVVIPAGVKSISAQVFRDCTALRVLDYLGSVNEWNAIAKDAEWNLGSVIETVHCTDGNVEITSAKPPEPEHDGSRGLLYRVNNDQTASFISIGTCTDTDIVIATTYMGYPVKHMAMTLRDITFIKSIVLPEGLEEIPSSAFSGCTSLEYVHIPSTVKSIGSHAFANCTSLTEIELPDSLESIGEYAFGWCSSLKKLKIPESVTYVGSDILHACDSIDEIFIPKSVTNLGLPYNTDISKFKIDPLNPKYSFKGNCIIDKETKTLLIVYKNAVLPDDGSIEIIGEEAFGWVYNLITELILPEGVRYMQNSGFHGFDCIEYLHLPSTFEGFDEYALGDTYDLKKITVAKDNPYYYVEGDCLIDRRTNTVILGLSTSVIPDDGSIKYIGIRAFAESAIKSVRIPEGVISIDGAAFYGCTSLTDVILPESLEHIGYNAFALCSSLKKINIGDNVKIIEGDAFSSCSALEEIILPKQIESLGDGVFQYCTSLKRILLPQGFEGADYLFTGCPNLEEIVLPDGMKTIGKFFYGDCDKLINIIIPEGVTEIDYDAFYHCNALESLVIPKSVVSIGTRAFSFCFNLKDVYFEGTVEEWKAVEKGKDLNMNSLFTVIHCSDGDVSVIE